MLLLYRHYYGCWRIQFQILIHTAIITRKNLIISCDAFCQQFGHELISVNECVWYGYIVKHCQV